jgi:hypothetical protein
MVDKKGGPCVGQKYERWITNHDCVCWAKFSQMPPTGVCWWVAVWMKKKTVHKRLRDGMLLTKKLSDWGSIHGHDQWWIRLRRLDACYVCNMILSLEIERWTSIKKWWVRHLVLIKKRPHIYQIHIFLPLLAKSEGVFSINMCVRWRWMNTNSAHIA